MCQHCEQEFESGHKHRLFCSKTCSEKGKIKQKIKGANEKWAEDKPKKKPKYNFSQLNRMSEWKRLYDDETWTNRFNGRRG